MATPDAEQFAKAMLWHLTGLRADVNQISIYILEQKAMQTGRSHQELLDEWQAASVPFHERLYREALDTAGLKDHRAGKPPDSGASSDPSSGGPSRL